MASNPCHRKLVGLLQTQERSLNLLYGRYATEMSYILKRYRLKSSSNTWKGNARAEKEIDALLLRMQSEMEQFILGGVEQGWDMSNVCNDNLTNKYLKGIDVRNAEQYFSRN